MHDIAQKQIFLKKLPELDPDPDLVKFPDPAKGPDLTGSGSVTLHARTAKLGDPC